MFKRSKPALTILVAAVAVALMWSALSLCAPPPGRGGGKNKDQDTTPPAAVDTLVVLSTTSSSIELGWFAVADDNGGPAAVYDIRHSTSPILSDADFDSAMKVLCDPVPAAPGDPEIATVGDLSGDTLYDLALKVGDEAGNWSALSNVLPSGFAITDVTPPGGWALEVVDPLGGPGHLHSLALAYDAPGNPSIAYEHSQRVPNTSRYIHLMQLARWDGVGWEIELIEEPAGGDASYLDLAYDPTSGEATVSYAFRTHVSPSVDTTSLRFARRIAANDWSIEIIDGGDSTNGRFNFTSLAYDLYDLTENPIPSPSISYRYRAHKKDNPGLKFAFLDAETSSWVLEMVDPGDEQLGNSLAYDPGTGEATIAYYRVEPNALKFCRRDAPGSWNIEPVATTGDQRLRGVSLAYDLGGKPSIAFQVGSSDYSGDDILKFARWDGLSWVVEEVDTHVYSYSRITVSSLAYDALGTAYISYVANDELDVSVRVVKLARRIGPNNWTSEIVTTCVAAFPTSLKFDPNGNPSVGYSDALNDQLKFARIVP